MMGARYVCIWFTRLMPDWLTLKQPELLEIPFGVAAPDHGRLLITAVNSLAANQGIYPGMAVADAKALIPGLKTIEEEPGKQLQVLEKLAAWCIRYTPAVALHPPDALLLEANGCTHLWNGEAGYLQEIADRLHKNGFSVRLGMADTIGAAWAISRFGRVSGIALPGDQVTAILDMPPAGLRLETPVLLKLQKLGFRTIRSFINLPRASVRRRFGTELLLKMGQAVGTVPENFQAVEPPPLYGTRLPCLEPVRTAPGIRTAIMELLKDLCAQLQQDGKGLRTVALKCYRVDGHVQELKIGTSQPNCSPSHLMKLFELNIRLIEPKLGIELFYMQALRAETLTVPQEDIWKVSGKLVSSEIAELMDRLENRLGQHSIQRYLPAAHFWPERSYRPAADLQEEPCLPWNATPGRPVRILASPQPIQVSAPIPDYPPMLFIYQGNRHLVKKADGPERIEREWWIDPGEHRDYYRLEDEQGKRYWVFRSRHYRETGSEWFIHGFFS